MDLMASWKRLQKLFSTLHEVKKLTLLKAKEEKNGCVIVLIDQKWSEAV